MEYSPEFHWEFSPNILVISQGDVPRIFYEDIFARWGAEAEQMIEFSTGNETREEPEIKSKIIALLHWASLNVWSLLIQRTKAPLFHLVEFLNRYPLWVILVSGKDCISSNNCPGLLFNNRSWRELRN